MFVPWLTLFDFANFRANFKTPIDMNAIRRRSYDFVLLVPIFNDLKYLTNIDFLKRYRQHVILCTTTQETPAFVSALESLAQEHGFRISYSEIEGSTKNPWAIYYKTLLAHDFVLKRTIHTIAEKYVIFIDGDTYVDGDLAALCGAMAEHALDIASVKILPARRKTVIEHLQGVEYDIAMRARLIYPWLTSGAGMVAKTTVMNAVMENHSLFFNGGDIEIGKLADMMRYKVGHLPMVFYTDIPSSFRNWVNQRRSWTCGMFRHAVVNLDLNLWYPFHFIYYSTIIYFLYPFKILEILTHPHLLPLIMVLYMAATFIANWKVRSKWMVIFPAYALFQVLVVVWLGLYRYVSTVRKTGNIGKIRIRHNPNRRTLRQRWGNGWTLVKNYALILLTTVAIMIGAMDSFQHLVFQQPYRVIGFVAALETRAFEMMQRGWNALSNPYPETLWSVAIIVSLMLALLLIARFAQIYSTPRALRVPEHYPLVKARYPYQLPRSR